MTKGALAGGGKRKIRNIFLIGVPALFLVMGGVASLRLREFVKRDPRFCTLCHQQRTDPMLWAEGAHASIVCQECHHQTEGEALRALLHVVDGSAAKKLHKPEVPVDSCSQCHARHDSQWPQISASEGHRLHAKANVQCKRCHATAIHQYGIPLDTCRDCHEKQVVKATGMEKLHCNSCHNFLTADRSLKPDRITCLRCHSSKVKLDSTFPDNAPMAGLACFACHQPHADEKPNYVECTECHKNEAAHGLHRITEHRACGDCHRAHSWLSERKMCTKCHRDQVSHQAHKECRECHEFTAARSGPNSPDGGADPPGRTP